MVDKTAFVFQTRWLTLLRSQAFWTFFRRCLIHGQWSFKKSGNRAKDPELKQAQDAIQEPAKAQEDPYSSSKLLKAIEICKQIIEEDKDKAPKDHRKILVFCNWTNMRHIIIKVKWTRYFESNSSYIDVLNAE